MGFIRNLINRIKLNKDYKNVFKPFVLKEKNQLIFLEIKNFIIPDNIASIYKALKESNNKKYINCINQYESLVDSIERHNDEVKSIFDGMIGFNKEEILNNILIVDKAIIESYYDVATKLSNYYDLNPKVLNFKKDAISLYDNYEIIRRQKKLYNEKEEIENYVDSFSGYLDDEMVTPIRIKNKFIDDELKTYKDIYYDFNRFLNFELLISNHNETFIENNKSNKLFDDINGKSLDDEQRESVLTDELSTLVVAGAGSGKTLTICGKVEYLIKEKNINPDEILLLSYSKKSADDLQLKVSSIDSRLTVGTFHKIGLDILKETQNKVFMVEDQYKAIIEKYFREDMKKNPKMLQNVLTYYGLYISSDKHKKKYQNEGEMFEDLKKQDFLTLKTQLLKYTNDINKRETLKKEHVKSFEEMAIANWYYINGIDYIYEHPYEINVSEPGRRQYMPDFYLPKYKIYHEHYGVDKNGRAKQFVGEEAEKYKKSMEWKKNTHSQNNTQCLETFSYEFDEGIVFEKLEKELKEKGVEIKPLSNEDIYNTLESIYNGKEFKSLINLISTFLSLYKARFRNDKGFDGLMTFSFLNRYERKRADLFLRIVKDVYHYYMDYLKSEDKIDFDDMILKSTEELDNSSNYKYKYIIVDEFQDISLSRMLFLKKLIEHGHSKLFAVGDDWQAIYRFSGCDLNIFLKFRDYFGVSEITKITTTHRNSQELQDIAGPFIKANPEQFNKRIKSLRHLEYPVQIMYYTDKKYYAFLDVLREIAKADSSAHVLVLGRNNRDFESIALDKRIYINYKKSNDTNRVITVTYFPNMSISYSTVHGSKGLEEDYVIIINADDTRLGFPNKMEDDELLDMVLSSKSNYEYAEERRLWYVALTRTKNYTYIIANKDNPSIFVDEIKNQCLIMNPSMVQEGKNVITCPRCKTGALVLRTNVADGSKFYGCSNYPYCDYTISDTRAVKRNKRCENC